MNYSITAGESIEYQKSGRALESDELYDGDDESCGDEGDS